MTYSAQTASRSNGSRGTALGREPLGRDLIGSVGDCHGCKFLPTGKGVQIFNEFSFAVYIRKQVASFLHHR